MQTHINLLIFGQSTTEILSLANAFAAACVHTQSSLTPKQPLIFIFMHAIFIWEYIISITVSLTGVKILRQCLIMKTTSGCYLNPKQEGWEQSQWPCAAYRQDAELHDAVRWSSTQWCWQVIHYLYLILFLLVQLICSCFTLPLLSEKQ